DHWNVMDMIQPAWRKLLMPSSTQPILTLCTTAGEWTSMNEHGSNSFLSILTALNWWGVQIKVDGAHSYL
ncbi:hypothetical protein SCLCIDRAFT_108004, partial [Scleroderma citrinum Foug A]